jgi:hypothetical protein
MVRAGAVGLGYGRIEIRSVEKLQGFGATG